MRVNETLTIINKSKHPLSGRLAVLLKGLPAGTKLEGATGSYQGSPYLDVLPEGRSLAKRRRITVTLTYLVPKGHDPARGVSGPVEVLQGL